MTDGQNVRSFPPLVDDGCRVLVLGTMPGVASLAAAQYYAHPRNAFWPVMARLLGQDGQAPYAQRCRWLLNAHVALWDVAATCRRLGSADADMRDVADNPVAALLDSHPAIGAVFFNGAAAQALFGRRQAGLLARQDLSFFRLPSTSPARAQPLEEKLRAWTQILPWLA